MIHAFAVDPEVAVEWHSQSAFRTICREFGLGTPRVMLEIPAFTKWKRAVWRVSYERDLTDMDKKRLEQLLVVLGEGRVRRADATYDSERSWLENSEAEWERRAFRGVLAKENPRDRPFVVLAAQRDEGSDLWDVEDGDVIARTPEAIARCIEPMLASSPVVHLVDPYFGCDNAGKRQVLRAIAKRAVASAGNEARTILIHCSASKTGTLAHFEDEAAKMAAQLPKGIVVAFNRWEPRDDGDELHNRYVLADCGGVRLGNSLQAGKNGATDDVNVLVRKQFDVRWALYCLANAHLHLVDQPKSIEGQA